MPDCGLRSEHGYMPSSSESPQSINSIWSNIWKLGVLANIIPAKPSFLLQISQQNHKPNCTPMKLPNHHQCPYAHCTRSNRTSCTLDLVREVQLGCLCLRCGMRNQAWRERRRS